MKNESSSTMAEDAIDNKSSSSSPEEEKRIIDPELFSCLLQPPLPDSDSNYVGIRRLLLYRKAESGVDRRKDWKCNGKGYVSFRNYIRRPRNWESVHIQSGPSTPGQSGRWVSPGPLSYLFEVDSWTSSRDLRGFNQASSHRTSFSSTDTDRPLRRVEHAYSFVGMHCIFDNCKASVTVLKFGHMSSDLLAYGASDGTLTVCTVSEPPSIGKTLRGHSKDVTENGETNLGLPRVCEREAAEIGQSRINRVVETVIRTIGGAAGSEELPNEVRESLTLPKVACAGSKKDKKGIGQGMGFMKKAWTGNAMHGQGTSAITQDFDFSSNNQYVASSSMDKTVRVWEISKGHCIRVIYGVSSQLCIRFHPVNNNFVSVGNANREITVINFSTGRIVNKANFDNEITAMDHDHTGQLIFCGDSQGCIYTVNMNSRTGALSRSHRNRSSSKRKSPIATVQYRTFSLLARGPVLLTCTQDGNLSFFSVALEIQGYLTLRCSLKLAPRLHSIRASFCPLLSLEKGEYIVSGSEDANVYFYDLTRPKHTCVNKLQGHGSPVIGIAWNHGENLLASSDSDGTVIVWKRAKTS
ncbi:hypothetical protein GIB67_026668 [Kingdonia uniflora]|uniref:Uncharacterized protein n=1 Tax=Kingdonia uniflora TaxID=39325 RepID=A0A7J7MGX1_9MAGN|nr:hypothetical protein GIB67_026668 [Kingdonia uniflora]